jgi:hypothetical protein
MASEKFFNGTDARPGNPRRVPIFAGALVLVPLFEKMIGRYRIPAALHDRGDKILLLRNPGRVGYRGDRS